MKKDYTLINYLMEKHADQYIGLDDDMPDDCNDWLEQLDVEEVIDYAERYISKNFIPKSKFTDVIAKEINIARQEGEKTSRLTSLLNQLLK